MVELLEREELLGQLAEAHSAGGRLLFVGGEAGVGKTSLTRAFCQRVDATVLNGACDSLTTPTPLGPFLDVAAQAGGRVAAAIEAGAGPRELGGVLVSELERPTVLVLEDVHWADEATLDVLRVLGRRVETTRSLVLVTYRDDEVDAAHPLRRVLGELASSAGVGRCQIPPLSLDGVRALVAPVGGDAEAIYSLTHGNPFYVTEILAGAGQLLPSTVRDAVIARAARLDDRARRLLDVAALVPTRAELWLLDAVAADELAGLEACLASGVVREEPGAIAFRHELARLAIESAVPVHRSRELHATILAALSSPPAGVADEARLAHHAEKAGDEPAAHEHSWRAGERATQLGAHREAAAQFARALRYAVDAPTAERASLLAAYAHEVHLTGSYDEAIAARTEAIGIYRALGDLAAAGENLSLLTMPYVAAGRNAEAEAAGRAAIDVLLELPPSAQLAGAYAFQSYMRMLNRDNAEGVEWGKKALALAERFGDADTRAMALNMIGTSYVMAGEIERGIDYLVRSLEAAREHGLELRIASAYTMLGSGLGEMYELERAEGFLRDHIAFAAQHDLDSAYTSSWLAAVHVYRGRWDEGAALARDVLNRAGGAISPITALVALGRVRARRGDPGAGEALDEALELSRPGGHLQRLGHVHAARAEAAWLRGDRERAAAEAQAAYALALEKRHLWFAGELAYWQWKAGVLDGPPSWIAEPYRLQLAGDAHESAEAWRDRGCPYEAARALAEADDEEALLQALHEFEQLGAEPAAKLARQALRARGAPVPRGPRPATRANSAGLTSRELEVLRLVAYGLRNADIATRLVLSPRTVDHHVAAILRKLEARTRGEAASTAVRLGLLEDP